MKKKHAGKIDVYNEILEFLENDHEGFSLAGLDALPQVKKEIEALAMRAMKAIQKTPNRPKR